MEFGVLYAATGSNYRKEARQSARSLKEWMPDYPIAIHTDFPEEFPRELFDFVEKIEKPQFSYVDKIPPLLSSPFKNTLFLDTDTLIVGRIDELKELLSRFELAYCHDTARFSGWDVQQYQQYSKAFPEPNSGVILFRNSDKVRCLFRNWYRIYQKQMASNSKPKHDQASFREAVYLSDLNFTILPPEYNLRTVFPFFIGKRMYAKILHGDEKTMRRAARINMRKRGYVIGYCNYARKVNRLKKDVKRAPKIFLGQIKRWIKIVMPTSAWEMGKKIKGIMYSMSLK